MTALSLSHIEKIEAVFAMHESGLPATAIARRLGPDFYHHGVSGLIRFAKDIGCLKEACAKIERNADRDKAIIEAYLSGLSPKKICAEFGLTGIGGILAKHGVKSRRTYPRFSDQDRKRIRELRLVEQQFKKLGGA